MALKLPVLSRTTKKEDVDTWLTKTASTQPNTSNRRSVEHPRQLKIERNEENAKADTAVPEKHPETAGEEEEESSEYAESDDVPEVAQEEPEATPSMKTYSRAAKRLGVIPLRKVLSELCKDRMCFRNLTLTTRDMKALCTALLRERDVVELDFSGNYIGGRECDYLVCVLSRANSIETLDSKSLRRVDLAWNGFGFEGCVALSDTLARNHTLHDLDISSNRINPPALMELVKGLARNKTLKALRIGQNPITASFTCMLLNTLLKNPTMAIDNLDMEGIVVDRDFQTILEEIRTTRPLHVNYDLMLPVKALSRDEMMRRIQAPGAYNLDPLHMFYLLKQKMRASDFFYKINKDNDGGVSRDELNLLFQEAGIPVTRSVIDAIVEFMDADGDGTIDLGEFMSGDKKIKKISRQVKPSKERKKKGSLKDDGYKKYSRTFKKAELDPATLSVKVEPSSEPSPANTENVQQLEGGPKG
ncbi:leucine-rich repeat-containing protein 74A-like [Littorina saxatilis]|uniref:leucine-rich repeat-containing protein 74A-like n=1 Tax=Littorina saxatilis TaxID=31220 RepID=UPI0038B499B0